MTHSFTVSQLVGQFILGSVGTRVPEGWASERIGDWVLGRHPSLPEIRLLGDDDRIVGWFLGYPIDGKGKLWNGRETIRIPGVEDSTASRIEEFVYSFGGRFLVALVGVRQPRLYLDPCGSLSVVYCAHQEVVVSTPNLIPYDEQTRDRTDLIREMGIPEKNAMYPLELTPRNNVVRLVPNHFLDLSQWQSVRHWPKQAMASEGSVDDAVTAIAAITKRNIAAVVSRTPTYLRMTAGNDSRMLLACAKDVADRLELFTVPVQDDGAKIDLAIARKIARRFGLRHFVSKFEMPKQEDLDEYMFRIGYGTGEPYGWQAATMFKQANPAYAQLDGGICGLERGKYYDISDTESTKVTPERLLKCCNAPSSELTLSPLKRWLDTVPSTDPFHILDLFCLEQRIGGWQGMLPYAEARDPGFQLLPVCHREIITRMLTLPTEYRRLGFLSCRVAHVGPAPLMKEIIEREWPELLEFPINKPIGLLRMSLAVRRYRSKLAFQADRAWRGLGYHAGRVEKALRNPGWAVKRIWNRLF
jgi:hypothetical protein